MLPNLAYSWFASSQVMSDKKLFVLSGVFFLEVYANYGSSWNLICFIALDVVMSGVGYHHAGLDMQDRKTVENLFAEASLPVLCRYTPKNKFKCFILKNKSVI